MNARILFGLVAVTLIAVAGALLLLQTDEPVPSAPGGPAAIAAQPTERSTSLPPAQQPGARQAIEGPSQTLPSADAESLVPDQLAAVILGRVVGPAGQPRIAATVEVFLPDTEGFQFQLQATGLIAKTDGAGEFTLVGVPSHRALIVEARADNAAPMQVDVASMATGESRHLGDLLLSSGTMLIGLVRDEGGQPLPNALIEVFDASTGGGGPNGSQPVAVARSDGSGEYRVEYLAQRQYSIHAGLEGYTPMTSVLAFVLGGAGPEWRQNFTLWRADTILAGRVIAADGRGIPDVELRLIKRQKGGLNTYFTVVGHTDEQGAFQFDDIPEGLFDVTVNAAQWYIDRTLRLESPRTDHEIIMHPSLTVRGLLSAVADLPERFAVTVKPDGRTGARLLQGGSATRTYSKTNPPGTFAFAGLRPGAYSFLVKAPGFAIARSQDVILGSAQLSADVVIPLFQGAGLTGQVLFADEASETVPSGRIELRDGEWAPGLAIETAFPTPPLHGLVKALDGEGRFSLQHIPAGNYVVTARVEGAPALHRRDITLSEGQLFDLGTLALPRGGRVSGRITGTDGLPVSGARVRLSGPAFHAEVSTRADGTFLAAQLPAGAYDIDVSPAGIFEALRQQATGQVVVAADQESVVELMLSERVVGNR